MASLNIVEWSSYVQYYKSCEQLQVVVFTIRKQRLNLFGKLKKRKLMQMKKIQTLEQTLLI